MKRNISRRDVLKALGQVAAATPAAAGLNACVDSGAEDERFVGSTEQGVAAADVREPIQGLALPGVHAYAQKKVAAGETIDFRISSTYPFQIDIVRLGWDLDSPGQDFRIARLPTVPNPVPQLIRAGSYIHVPSGLPASVPLTEMTLECWVRPWKEWNDSEPGYQALISQFTQGGSCGFGLFIGATNIFVYFGNGGGFDQRYFRTFPYKLARRSWSHLVATFNAGKVLLWVNGKLVSAPTNPPSSADACAPPEDPTSPALLAVVPGTAPLRLAAAGDSGATANLFDGDLAMPVIYSRALNVCDVSSRMKTPPVAPTGSVLGCWPFSEETGSSVSDVGPARRHGQIINNATWMIGGPGFVGPKDRFTAYDPATDVKRGHALRFASDDLYDCGWVVTQSYTLPPELAPGVYVGRILFASSSYDVTFVVKRAASKPPAAILVLCSTNTWLAYNQPFPRFPDTLYGWGTAANSETAVAGSPMFNMYKAHSGSTPPYQMGVNLPWGIAAPQVRYGNTGNNYSHLVRAERGLHVWLEQNGYDFDVASDFDLHEDPTLFNRYKTVIVNGHSEYWSATAYDGLQAFLQAGGNVIVASGNTMFWRVSLDPAGKVMECRKMPTTVGGVGGATAGELYHSQDGKRGGLLRECNRPAWRLTGLESVGYGGNLYGPFTVTQADHSLFRTPEQVASTNGTALGPTNVVGHEYDVRVTQIPNLGSLAVPAGYAPVVLAKLDPAITSPTYFDYAGADAPKPATASICEVTYYERPEGGRVFAAGSIAVGRAIAMDAKLSALMRNVLHQFGAAHRLHLFAVGVNGQLLSKWWDGNAWRQSAAEWKVLGGPLANAPATASFAQGTVSVMFVNGAKRLSYKWWANGVWQPSDATFIDLGGSLRGQPCAVSWRRNRLDIFARATTGEVVRTSLNVQSGAPSPTGWQSLGGSGPEAPSAIAWQGNALSVSALSDTGRVLYKWQENDVLQPSDLGWHDLGGPFRLGPTLFISAGNRMNVLAVDSNGQLVTTQGDGKSWPASVVWKSLGGTLASAPIVVSHAGGQVTIFALFRDGNLWSRTGDGTTFAAWQNLGGPFVGTPAAVAFRGSWVALMAVKADGACVFKWWDARLQQASDVPWQDFGSGLNGNLVAIVGWVGTAGV